MQLASSLLHYWKDQHSKALAQRSKPTAAVHKKSSRTKSHDTHLLSDAILWGAPCLTTEIDDAFEQFVGVSELLEFTVRGAKSEKKQSKAKELSSSVARWLNSHLPLDSSDQYVALVATGWIYSMQYATATISSSLWLETLQNILTQVDRAWSDASNESLIPTMLWGCEIPLALATQIESIDGQTKLVSETRQRLRFLLCRVDNAEAMWLQRGGSEVRALLASVLRSSWMLRSLQAKELSKKDQKRLMRYARAGLSLSQVGGQPLLQTDVVSEDNELWHAFVKHWPEDSKLQALVKTLIRSDKRPISRSVEAELPPLGQNFEEAETAVMRRDWVSGSQLVAVDYSVDPMSIDIYGPNRRKLITGDWELEVRQDGQIIDIDSPWEQICWQSDDDVDYLELQCEAEGHCKVQRQIMLVRSEGIVYLCDTLLGDRAANWTVKSTLSLADDIDTEGSHENTEIRLRSRNDKPGKTISRPVALVLPIALPEWKRFNKEGQLETNKQTLSLVQSVEGNRLTCPLVIACGDKSTKSAYTWRQLTIAEDLAICDRATARGFRVQVGSDQLLFYRSLGEVKRRTMMSLHLFSEFYAGRFDSRDGDIESLIEVSAEE